MVKQRDNGKKPPQFDDLPVLEKPLPASPLVWLRRIVVWSTTIALLAWAFSSCYKVLSRRPVTEEEIKSAEATHTLPKSTGEYKYEDARQLFLAGRRLLRAGDLSGLETMREVVRLFPKSPQASQALLVIATTERYQLGQPQNAMRTYSDFLRRHPNHKGADRAVRALGDLARELDVRNPADGLLRTAIAKTDEDSKERARLEKLRKSIRD
ncbi:MAG: tetratricopeptide repeat protein [Candidatus Lernaella stagnicola]|nr:tetratricopeptide repeat protein [Candidatus Lernaella stagnicola]